MRVHILGNGNAAQKHTNAFNHLHELWEITSYDEAQVVDICTPNHLHFQQTVCAMMDGKDVMCEKPITSSLWELDSLIALEESLMYGTAPVMVLPIFQYALPTEKFTSRIFTRSPAYFEGRTWDTELGGCITSHMIHDIAAVKGADEVKTNSFGPAGIPERHADISVFLGVTETRLKTRLSTTLPHHNTFEQSFEGYKAFFSRAHDVLLEGGDPPISLFDARDTLEIVTAAYYSAYTGKKVELPITEDHPFYKGWTRYMRKT
jgi:hypothetical protein